VEEPRELSALWGFLNLYKTKNPCNSFIIYVITLQSLISFQALDGRCITYDAPALIS
jgi:hypothetical protein